MVLEAREEEWEGGAGARRQELDLWAYRPLSGKESRLNAICCGKPWEDFKQESSMTWLSRRVIAGPEWNLEDQTWVPRWEILDTSPLSRHYEYFFPVCDLSFNFLYRAFGRAKVLNFDKVQFVNLFFFY